MLKVLTVFGTRPEAIKMAPLIAELERHPGAIENKNCLTGQHKDMVAPLIELFGIRADYELNLMRENQTLEHITTSVLSEVGRILREDKFDLLLVQGDTTTSMAAALAAFYAGVKIGHVEAGLRTFDKNHPFPEEANRKMIDAVADLFFAHSGKAKQHLLNEGIVEPAIAVTGNTVIDALLDVSSRPFEIAGSPLEAIPFDTKRIVLVTAHRRESFGGPFESICKGLAELARNYADDIELVYPVHRNPNVREVVGKYLADIPNVRLLDPLDYLPLVQLMKRAHLVLTDSGGLQEEAPSLGKPVLVLRKVTERQEGVEAGTLKLVGTDAADIVREASRLLDDPAAYQAMATRANPYGDGTASIRIVQRILADAAPRESGDARSIHQQQQNL
jgi:UDP-N-acetylglucosamine 2-epimerase (non-hydrolysing)